MNQEEIVKTFKSHKGNEVIVRQLRLEDLDDLTRYANALIEEDTFILLSGKKLTRDEEMEYVADSLKKVAKGEKVHLVALINGVLASSCEVRRLNRRASHVGEIGISIAKEFREEGIGTELVRLLIEEAKKIGVTLLFLHCFDINARAIHVYEKVGFKKAGVIPGMFRYKDGVVGQVTMYLAL